MDTPSPPRRNRTVVHPPEPPREEQVKALTITDIILGRKPFISQACKGNLFYRFLLCHLREDYRQTDNPVIKMVTVNKVIEAVEMQNPPGRFLLSFYDIVRDNDKGTKTKTNWRFYEAPDKRVRQKVSQGLREARTVMPKLSPEDTKKLCTILQKLGCNVSRPQEDIAKRVLRMKRSCIVDAPLHPPLLTRARRRQQELNVTSDLAKSMAATKCLVGFDRLVCESVTSVPMAMDITVDEETGDGDGDLPLSVNVPKGLDSDDIMAVDVVQLEAYCGVANEEQPLSYFASKVVDYSRSAFTPFPPGRLNAGMNLDQPALEAFTGADSDLTWSCATDLVWSAGDKHECLPEFTDQDAIAAQNPPQLESLLSGFHLDIPELDPACSLSPVRVTTWDETDDCMTLDDFEKSTGTLTDSDSLTVEDLAFFFPAILQDSSLKEANIVSPVTVATSLDSPALHGLKSRRSLMDDDQDLVLVHDDGFVSIPH